MEIPTVWMRESQSAPATTQSSRTDLLDELEELTPRFDLHGLTDFDVPSANQALQRRTPLFESNESVDDHIIEEIRASLKRQILRYKQAIGHSIAAAQDVCKFAEEGIRLCQCFHRARSHEEVISFINDMRQLARAARENSESTCDTFRSIRTEIAKVSDSIPKTHIAMYDQIGDANPSSRLPNARSITFDTPGSHGANGSPSVSDILSRLLERTTFVGQRVAELSKWWIETETKLSSLSRKVGDLNVQRPNTLRLVTIQWGWVDARDRCLEYQSQVGELREVFVTFQEQGEETSPPLHSFVEAIPDTDLALNRITTETRPQVLLGDGDLSRHERHTPDLARYDELRDISRTREDPVEGPTHPHRSFREAQSDLEPESGHINIHTEQEDRFEELDFSSSARYTPDLAQLEGLRDIPQTYEDLAAVRAKPALLPHSFDDAASDLGPSPITIEAESRGLLDELEHIIPHFELQELVDSANQSLQLLAPLLESAASVDDPIIHKIKTGLEVQIQQYRRAMGESVTAAQDGYNFSMEGVHLCESFDLGRSPAELTPFIENMLKLARAAGEKSKTTSDRFRLIRTEIIELSKLIPGGYIALHNENEDVQASRLPNAGGNVFGALGTRVTTASQSVSEILSSVLKEIDYVGTRVSGLSNWWIETETSLLSISSKVERLDAGLANKLRLATIQHGWKEVRNRYFDYKIRVAGLRDLSLTPESTSQSPLPISHSSEQVAPGPENDSKPGTENESRPETTIPSIPLEGSSAPQSLFRFKRTLLILAEKTESATQPFHNTHTALNLYRDFPLEKFTADGSRLREFSIKLQLFLEKCYGYAQYFVTFPALLETGTIQDCSNAVVSISSRAKRLLRDAKGLAKHYDAQTKKILKHWDDFRRQLGAGGLAQRAQSLDGFPNALHQIRTNLSGLVTFWEDESRFCGTDETTISQLKVHATHWATYGSSIESAIASISKSSDYALGASAPVTVPGPSLPTGNSRRIFSMVWSLVRIRGGKS